MVLAVDESTKKRDSSLVLPAKSADGKDLPESMADSKVSIMS